MHRPIPAAAAGRLIAVIGAGYSGTLTALHLLEKRRDGDRVILFERRDTFGRGLAYSTEHDTHLLNVRAMNMSAYPDRPGHFLDWLRDRADVPDSPLPLAERYIPRKLYGLYVQDLLRDAVARHGGRAFELVQDEAVSLVEAPEGIDLRTAGGLRFRADAVVLACGNLPPGKIRGAYRGNPWGPAALKNIRPDAPVMIQGTGLTMVDTTLALLDRNHRGPIYAVSRRGLLPRRHRARILPDQVDLATLLADGHTVSRIMRIVRRRVREAVALGLDWRCVMDGLRPHNESLWRILPEREKRRFLRHLRPWWDVHRHRMAPHIAGRLGEARKNGQLHVFAARVEAVDADEHGARVRLRRRGKPNGETLEVEALIDCTGLKTSEAAASDPLLSALMKAGAARIDSLHLGLDVHPETDAVIGSAGAPSRRLFAVGPLTRAAHWEMIAVPDLRGQCARVAGHLLATVPPAAEPAEAPVVIPAGIG
jgi:uncharacterized NAD(P)/FAD-binding protein YdhS